MANQYSIELSRDEAAALKKKLAAQGLFLERDGLFLGIATFVVEVVSLKKGFQFIVRCFKNR